jgi:cytochrome oxidase Cu insertion factor (SCO1/SenC/PrrC family)
MTWRIRIFALLVVLALAGVGVWLNVRQTPETGNDAVGGLVVNADIGGPFTLTNQNGEPFSLTDLAGDYALVYFGYTFCPDVCPTELGKVATVIDLLGADGARITPVLVTIDPARDTVEALHGYVPLFHERLIGLTGTPEQIREVARLYRVFYRKAESAEYADYLMDHSSFVYLISPDGRVIAMYGYGTGAEAIADAIRRHMQG